MDLKHPTIRVFNWNSLHTMKLLWFLQPMSGYRRAISKGKYNGKDGGLKREQRDKRPVKNTSAEVGEVEWRGWQRGEEGAIANYRDRQSGWRSLSIATGALHSRLGFICLLGHSGQLQPQRVSSEPPAYGSPTTGVKWRNWRIRQFVLAGPT